MNKIKQLSAQEAQKIAAGEVVERPANIVKELVENSLDALATQISIYIEDGGKQLIRIVDNGCGMSVEDAHLCFKHHTTSKISSVDDLTCITTFGFRGEALSSISSVSKMTLITKDAEAEFGTSLSIERGIVMREEAVSCEQGTDISIADLFYNVPARKKFLKTKETEWRHIVALFEAFCLDNIHVHFKLFSDDKLLFNCPAVATTEQRIVQLWEHTFAQHMITLKNVKNNDVSVRGVISSHQYSRYDRNAIFFFVNSRWVKNYKLTQAALKGYLNVLQTGKFPALFLFITVDGAQVDINIHPRKEEVQFLHPRIVEQLITQAIKTTLEDHLSSHLKTDVHLALQDSEFAYNATKPAFAVNHVQPIQSYKDVFNFSVKPFSKSVATTPPLTPAALQQRNTESISPDIEKQDHIATIAETIEQEITHRVLGQLNSTYILLEKPDGMVLIDQHAAHERVLYELFAHRFSDVATISLLFPVVMHFSPNDIKVIEPHLHILEKSGIHVEVIGGDQLAVKSTPINLKNANMQELIKEVISWINEYQQIDKAQFFKTINEKLHAQMACKAAVKAGDQLSTAQMQQLVLDLEKTDNRFTCPHGRPTMWFISTNAIEKNFKRNYK
ncbi:MAG: DNA mismatch repair endonuclease MutL [Candidatus Dependentiae bacterium]|nr:DNA mismatch repair endonuclease MutL [Candidatus Dependentiae bacterium]